MSKTESKQRDPNVSFDPLLNVPADTRTDREKFIDDFTLRYQDKNPKEQAEAILWAIEQTIIGAMPKDSDTKK